MLKTVTSMFTDFHSCAVFDILFFLYKRGNIRVVTCSLCSLTQGTISENNLNGTATLENKSELSTKACSVNAA